MPEAAAASPILNHILASHIERIERVESLPQDSDARRLLCVFCPDYQRSEYRVIGMFNPPAASDPDAIYPLPICAGCAREIRAALAAAQAKAEESQCRAE